ncbi:helicase RepA family protein [Aeromonas caviae]
MSAIIQAGGASPHLATAVQGITSGELDSAEHAHIETEHTERTAQEAKYGDVSIMTPSVKTNVVEFVRFADLSDQNTIVIHTGTLASPNAANRQIFQRANNDNIVRDNHLDPEVEPEVSLYVSAAQLEDGGKLYKMADKDATQKIIVRVLGVMAFEKTERLVQELMRQAPSAEIYRGRDGQNAEPWEGLVSYLKKKANAEAENRPSRFTIISGYSGFDKQASYLVKGLLPAESTCSIFGPSGSFKSFAAVSLSCHIATGKPWDGRQITKGAVLYIVGEGGVGVPRRIRAWADQYNGGADVPNIYRIDMPVFMADPAQILELKIAADRVRAATGEPVRMIVIDTVARCFGGGDENRAADMGAFIAGCDSIKAMTKATILLIHHTGKNEENGARGSSAFRAAMDAEYLIKREADDTQALTLACTKMKDSQEPVKRAYDLRSRSVCFDDDGDEITSLVLVDQGREPKDPEADELSPLSKALFQAIKKTVGKHGSTTRDKVREEFKGMLIDGKKPNMTNYSRNLNTLVEEGLISVSGGDIRLVMLTGSNDEFMTSL